VKEGWLQLLRRKGSFAEFMILAWGHVEANLDRTFLAEFNLLEFISPKLSKDSREHLGHSVEEQLQQLLQRTKLKELKQIDLLLDIPLVKKMDFLRSIGAIEKHEYSTIDKFRKERNHLFHGDVLGLPFRDLSNSENDSIMDRGEQAVGFSFDIALRSLSKSIRP